MTLHIDRRLLLKAGTFGLSALAVPGTAAIAAARGFTHNVASGEPRARSVLLWTRYVPSGGGEARLEAQVSKTSDFSSPRSVGTVTASPDRDHTAKLVAEGLEPDSWYFFRFVGSDGGFSPVGRTRTLPEGDVARFKLGIFSCSNLPFGWFNAYAHAAARQDIDVMVHLGDYLYEYERGKYPSAEQALAGRIIDPASEMVALADYRMRHAAYRADADLQRLHQLFPMIAMWDDHESTNDSWKNGAENHQPETEGDWQVRKRASVRAYREWMPVSDKDFEVYQIGTLATIFRPETRLAGRSEPLNLGAALAGKTDLQAALTEFRDRDWSNPMRTLMGLDQEKDLAQALQHSKREGTRWQVLAQQVIMGSMRSPIAVAELALAGASEAAKKYIQAGIAASRAGLPFNFDQWDGFPAARQRLLKVARDLDTDLVVLSGDSHNAWAFDLDADGEAAGVEFAGQSVTSPGYETELPNLPPQMVAKALVDYNPQLKWADTSRRGYMTLELTPERVTNEWLFMDTIRERSTRIGGSHVMTALRGANKLSTM